MQPLGPRRAGPQGRVFPWAVDVDRVGRQGPGTAACAGQREAFEFLSA